MHIINRRRGYGNRLRGNAKGSAGNMHLVGLCLRAWVLIILIEDIDLRPMHANELPISDSCRDLTGLHEPGSNSGQKDTMLSYKVDTRWKTHRNYQIRQSTQDHDRQHKCSRHAQEAPDQTSYTRGVEQADDHAKYLRDI